MSIFIKIRSTLVLLLLVLLVGQGEYVFAAQSSKQVDVYFVPMQFMFDDNQLTPPSDQQGFIYKNSAYVPMRFISYALDKSVKWDQAAYAVSVSKPTEEEQSTIDIYKRDREVAKGTLKPMDSSKVVASGIKVYEQKLTYLFDGTAKQPQAGLPGLIYQDRLYVPMRFFSEAVGQKIEWDPKTYTVKNQTEGMEVMDSKPPATASPTPAPTSTQTPSPTPATTIIGEQRGGATIKPTYEEIKNAAEVKMAALETKAVTQLFSLYLKYMDADEATKVSLKAEGNALMAGYDAEFAVIKSSAQSQLIANGYETSIIAEYQQDYDNKKKNALQSLK